MTKIVTIVQARCGSSRLPGKILMPVLGQTTLYRMIERLEKSKLKGTIVIATTDASEDDIIVNACENAGWEYYCGHEHDLLDRHYQVASKYNADIIIKIPSDCPLIDHRIVDKVIRYFLDHKLDYVSNLHPPTYPDGNDVEIMTITALEKAWMEANAAFEREHTTPYIWENPSLFSIGNVTWEKGLDYAMSHRLTLDYGEDYNCIKAIFEALYPYDCDFSLDQILKLLENRIDIFEMNKKYAGVNWYRHHLDELKTIESSQTKILM